MDEGSVDWAARAAAAERAVVRRHLRPLGGVLPGTRIGRIRWPRMAPVRPWPWHYWWQAHLLDCLVGAGVAASMLGCQQPGGAREGPIVRKRVTIAELKARAAARRADRRGAA